MSETTLETLQEAILYFADERRSHDFVARMRWGDKGPICPRCGSQKVTFLEQQRRYQCSTRHPSRQFSVKVGTIFEDSPLPLSKWLPAVWMIGNAKNGVSSYEIARNLDVTQKSAWFMLHRIRLAMNNETFGKIGGEVEADETYIGGKSRFMHKSKRAEKITGTGGMGKTAVMGLLERHGPEGHSQVRTEVVPNVRRKTLSAKVRENVIPGSEVFTDALKPYTGLEADYIHAVIDHAEAYAKGKVHTNGPENFLSLLKRVIRGTYVNVESFRLSRYLDEESFRFNSRKTDDGSRFQQVLGSVEGKRLTYKKLYGSSTTPV